MHGLFSFPPLRGKVGMGVGLVATNGTPILLFHPRLTGVTFPLNEGEGTYWSLAS